MEVIPAIDLRAGRVVRLYQGDFHQETVYSEDPVAVALQWQKDGAPRIHIVDLDGAVAGRPVNMSAVKEIAAQVTIPLQVGGGIRDMLTAKSLLHVGVERVVLGTAAIYDPDMVRTACDDLGVEAVVVAVDARSGKIAVRGWLETVEMATENLVMAMAEKGVRRFIYTDIATDGTLLGPNVDGAVALMKAAGVSIICSGGIGSMADLERLAKTGIEGVIVGSALYQGAINLEEAVRRFGG